MLHSGYDRSLVEGLMIWTLRTCPLAGGSVILLCLFVCACLGCQYGLVGLQGGQ